MLGKHRLGGLFVAMCVAACSSSETDQVGTRESTGRDSAVITRGVLPPPKVVLSAEELAYFRPLPPRKDAIPVLLFHQVCPSECLPTDTYGVSQLELARMLHMLRVAGFTTISMAAYDAFHAGSSRSLPSQPILVTFDDGRLDAYRGADAILAAAGARATQFIITEKPESGAAQFMSWTEIAAAQASGRWDIQLHAHHGHRRIPTSSAPGNAGLGAFYGNLAYSPALYPEGNHLEPFEQWQTRTETDLREGEALLAKHVPGYEPLTFALPFGDYGQFRTMTNDERIAPSQRAFLDRRFRAWFTQPSADPDFTTRGKHEVWRYTIRYGTTAETLYAWLASHSGPGGMREALKAALSSDAGRD